MPEQKVYLMVLDGFGEGKSYPGNAIQIAHMSYFETLRKTYPVTLLKSSGEAVGLPEGTMGGSEVGHFTMGAGRVIFQSLEEINRSIKDGSFFQKKPLLEAMDKIKKTTKAALHLLGMISDAGVHSHLHHLFALLELAKKHTLGPIFIHAITDGRDVPERTAKQFINVILNKIEELKMNQPFEWNGQKLPYQASLATIIGRYYAMDRDSNWDRTEKAYNLYTLGEGTKEQNPLQAIEKAYKRGVETDYYIDPILLDERGLMKDQDVVIFWNFRTDRTKQITQCFTGEKKAGFMPQKIVKPFFVCFGDYSSVAPVVFPTQQVKNNIGSVIEQKNLEQLRIAETEKYAHVTYFFNSQIEKPFAHETRVLIDSPKVPSYAEKPQMSASGITERVIEEMNKNKYALIVQNFANPDLVGHSGKLEAAVKACQVMDECIQKIHAAAQKNGYVLIITADHGNAEYMIYDNGEPCPSHTMNPVIFLLASENYRQAKLRNGGGLEDVAPTILDIMGIEKPSEMTGKTLLITEQ